MICSGQRKLALSGWLQENRCEEYNSPLKLQKYLFFYEVFSKINGDVSDFHCMRGYARGPVFSNVWGDYTHERKEFDMSAMQAYESHSELLCEDRAKRSGFLVSIMSEKELSDLTHKMNIWKAQESRIVQGLYQVSLSEDDFNENDWYIIQALEQMYPISLIDNSHLIKLNNCCFVFAKEDVSLLTAQHFDTLCFLSENEDLHNPVFVEIDEEGRLIVD